jgi:anti-sigma-K factor RskA
MSDTPIDPMHELVEDYALGMLDDAQRAAFESRLRVDADLRMALAATHETLSTLAFSTPATPAPGLKHRVMERLGTAATPGPATKVIRMASHPRASRTPLWLGTALAASLVLIARLSFDLSAAHRDAASAVLSANVDRRSLAQRDSLIAQLTDPATETVTLAATGAARPVIKAYVDRAHRTMMLSAGLLDTLPVGRAYQVWFIVDGKPVPSVTFRPDAAGRALLRALPIPSGAVAATAITQEPAGGSTAPTTPVLFVGKLATE